MTLTRMSVYRPVVALTVTLALTLFGIMSYVSLGLENNPALNLPYVTVTAVYPVGGPVGDLVVVHGTDVRTVPSSQGSIRIGRGPHNDLVIARPGVSRDHVVVEVRGDAWWIVPDTSHGGTTLDGVPLDGPAQLEGTGTLGLGRGVRIRLGVE